MDVGGLAPEFEMPAFEVMPSYSMNTFYQSVSV